MHFKKGLTELFAIVIITVIGVGSIWGINQFTNLRVDQVSTSKTQKTAIPTSDSNFNQPSESKFEEFPFMELTIPYLRYRDFSSSLEQRDLFEKRANYTAYTTSYQSDGLTINSYLTIPDGDVPEGGWPAIVFIHGYIPPSVYKTTQNYVNYVDYFAKNGFVVIKPDLRGHDNSEGESLGAYFSGDYIIDTLNAYTALQNSEFVNPDQVGLWGHSMGGNVVFRSLVANQNIPATVIWAGAVYTYEDMQKFSIQDNSYRPPTDDSFRRRYRQQLNQAYGSFSADSEFWQKVVPTNYTNDVEGKLQIHHAVDDAVVNIGYSRDLVRILEDSSIEAELVEYPTGGHNIISPSFERAMQSSVEFYRAAFGID